MSHIHDLSKFKEVIGDFKPCPGMQRLIDSGAIVIDTDNIDEKGIGYTVTLMAQCDRTIEEIWIRFCPCCGNKIFNALMPQGGCHNPDLPENRV